MSWIIGAIPRNKNSFDNSFFLSSENIKLKYKSNKFEIYAGGFSKNLHFVKNSNLPSNGGIVSGIGFQNNNVNTKILSNDDWTQILSSKNSNNKINNLDGHFVIVEWDENLIKFNRMFSVYETFILLKMREEFTSQQMLFGFQRL